MRKRFEQQIKIGSTLIQDVAIPTKKRSGALPGLCAALKEIFVTPEWNEKVFTILEDKILSQNNKTGRPGMDLWHVFVLSQVRLCQNISYDDLHYLANYDRLVRQIMGVENDYGMSNYKFGYQSIIDNVGLLDDESVRELNSIIVDFGHYVFKKKEEEALCLKTDSFVVESNVHFPTDYNLLWDCARKCLDIVARLYPGQPPAGWRKNKNWSKDLKNKMRALGRASASGGKGKADRVRQTAKSYLTKAKALHAKLGKECGRSTIDDNPVLTELFHYMVLLQKHIDLLERRVIKGEEIPHEEKMFSIFETYTEWIKKGKMRPNVELGKKAAITTDQYNLIVDYQIIESQSDSECVPQLAQRISLRYRGIASWSFDKGYWKKENKELLSQNTQRLVLPKKGKCNKQEYEQEHQPWFIKARNRHSAIESNINELEHRGLDRCPDKGYGHFKRYVGLAVSAYNLRRIGVELIRLFVADQHSGKGCFKAA